MWKRREAILKWEWDLVDNVDAAEVRPEFESEVKGRRFLSIHYIFIHLYLSKII